MTRSRQLTQKMFHTFILGFSCILIWFGGAFAGSDPSPVKLSFGIVPQQSATKLAAEWTPVMSYLSSQTGYQIHFMTAKNIPTFEERCKAGEYDLAYMNPYHYTNFHDSPGYIAFAKQKLKSLKGIIVVRKDAPNLELKSFAGKTLVFPSPNAFAASIITRAHLAGQGIDFTAKYVSSHDSVYRGVAKGLFPAGGGVPRTFNATEDDVRNQLRILWTSKGYTPHAIAAHPRVKEEIVKNILQVLTEMDKTPDGKKLLDKIKFKGIVPAHNNDWDDVRSLKIAPNY